jgi:predicted RNA methylase
MTMRQVKDIDREEAREQGGQYDNWVTPPWATAIIIPHIHRRRTGAWVIIDPGCGCGDVSIVAAKSGMTVRYLQGLDIHEGRAAICAERYDQEIPDIPHSVQVGDWTAPTAAGRLREWANTFNASVLVLANPPYTKPRETVGLEFVQQAIRVAAPRGIVAMLLPLDFAAGVVRAEAVHDKWCASCYPLRRRPQFGTQGGSGQRPVAWFVWDLANPNRGEFRVL